MARPILSILLVMTAARSFVSPASIGPNASPAKVNAPPAAPAAAAVAAAAPQQQQQDDVAQLERLKDALAQHQQQHPASHKEQQQPASPILRAPETLAKRLATGKNVQPFASAAQPLVGPRSLDVITRELGVSPMQLAEYVFWTGDERGVSLAIQEFLQQGLVSRDEAATFLREVRQSITILQSYYAERKAEQQAVEQEALERAAALQEALAISKLRQEQQRQAESKALSEDEYSDLLQHLKDSDAQYTELTLQEVIYQLAKLLFSQNLVSGNGQEQAQNVMRKFSSFLKEERSQMPQEMQRKVFEVLSAALVDAMREQPLNSATPAPLSLSPGPKGSARKQ